MCREGNSWLKKRRFFYIPEKNLLYCHNCGWSGGLVKWLKEITGMSFDEIRKDVIETTNLVIPEYHAEVVEKPITATLPMDCINLTDSTQLEYFKENTIIKAAITFLKNRRLLDAINKPLAYYISLTDYSHKNRIIIPFYDESNKIVHYQSRCIIESEQSIRYISKINSEKTLFNVNNINPISDTYFVFEGPFNSCFCKNGIAVAGIQEGSKQRFTTRQQKQIDNIPFKNRIWVLDSQWIDRASYNKSKILLEMGENVFIWPRKLGLKLKDFNDIAIKANINEISEDFVKSHSHHGMKGLMLLNLMKV